jgi:hypothetical protein
MSLRRPMEWQAKEVTQIPTSHTYPMSRDCCKSKVMQSIAPTISSQGVGSATIFSTNTAFLHVLSNYRERDVGRGGD